MEENKDYIDIREVAKTLWEKKSLFLKIWIVTFILACAYILPQPRVYTTSTVMAPETSSQSVGGSLAGIASSFGISLGGSQGDDAIYPELYPNLVGTYKFAVDMLYTTVQTNDGRQMTYLDFIRKERRENPVLAPFNWCRRKIKALFEDNAQSGIVGNARLNPNRLNKKQTDIVELVLNNISCDVDIKTSVITISVNEQDPLVAVQLADSTRVKLQDYITEYRTNKARVDVDYYRKLMDNAKKEFNNSVKEYSAFCDANQDVVLQRVLSKRDELENEMSAKLATYNALNTQYTMAMAKVQERTPAFTVLSEAAMPIKASKPKRMIFVAAMLFLATIAGGVYVFRKDLLA